MIGILRQLKCNSTGIEKISYRHTERHACLVGVKRVSQTGTALMTSYSMQDVLDGLLCADDMDKKANPGIKLDIKLKVYLAVVLPTLLYACDTWTVYQRHPKKTKSFPLKLFVTIVN